MIDRRLLVAFCLSDELRRKPGFGALPGQYAAHLDAILPADLDAEARLDILADKYCWLPVYVPIFGPPITLPRGSRISGVGRVSPRRGRRASRLQLRGHRHEAGRGDPQRPLRPALRPARADRGSGRFHQPTLVPWASEVDAETVEALPLSAGSIRRTLGRTLPEYMLPSHRLCLFGHSVGALVAYETARALSEAGRPAGHLIVSGRRAPHSRRAEWPLPGLTDEQLRAAADRLGWFGRDGDAAAHELADMMLPTLRADIVLSESYRYVEQEPLPTPIFCLTQKSDDESASTEVTGNEGPDEAWGWTSYSHAAVTAESFAGDHFFIYQNEREVIATLRRIILLGDS